VTREKVIERNDTIRRFLRPAPLLTAQVKDLDNRLIGRAVYVLSRYSAFSDDSDHSEGVFIFAGYSWTWWIEELAGEVRLTLGINEDLLLRKVE
jgi:hypothetical protein